MIHREPEMPFLVIDGRFGTPIYAFLERDPRGADDYPGLAVREVAIEPAEPTVAAGQRLAVGRDPRNPDRFREFGSDGAVRRAGFILIEPRYVGVTWEAYISAFRPQGEESHKGRRAFKT